MLLKDSVLAGKPPPEGYGFLSLKLREDIPVIVVSVPLKGLLLLKTIILLSADFDGQAPQPAPANGQSPQPPEITLIVDPGFPTNSGILSGP